MFLCRVAYISCKHNPDAAGREQIQLRYRTTLLMPPYLNTPAASGNESGTERVEEQELGQHCEPADESC